MLKAFSRNDVIFVCAEDQNNLPLFFHFFLQKKYDRQQ